MTSDYHERSRLYGFRHAAYTVGSIIALASMQVLINAEQESPEAVRTTAFHLSVVAGLVSAVLVGLAVVVLRERDDYRTDPKSTP